MRTPSGNPPPTEPIELKTSRAPWWDDLKWIIGLWFGALVLFGDPDVLWTRWLAWPVATALLLGSAVPMLSAVANWRAGLVASASGLDYRNGVGTLQQVTWQQVGAVKLMAYYGRQNIRSGPNAPTSRVLERETFLLLDKSGQTLLEVDAPLRPESAYGQLLDALPVWTGLPVLQEKQDRR